jgi:hypothetical protein
MAGMVTARATRVIGGPANLANLRVLPHVTAMAQNLEIGRALIPLIAIFVMDA